MNDKIKKLKDLLFELDSKHSVGVPDTQQNINDVSKRIVKLFAIPVVVNSLPSECQGNWQSNYYCTLSGKCQKCEK